MRRLAFVPLVLAAPTAVSAQETPVTVKYDKGFTMVAEGDQFEMKTGIRGQIRNETVRKEQADEIQSAFLIPRLRLQLEGFAYGHENAYKVEFDMANKGSALLKDYYYDHAFHESFHVRVGQWKRPFSRHEMVSDFGSTFLERAKSNEFAGAGRDLGVAVHNDYEKSPDGLEWALGVFNGASEKGETTCEGKNDAITCKTTNVPDDLEPAIVVRAGWNHGGIKGYSDGDLEGGPLRVAVGASYRIDLNDLREDPMGDLDLDHRFEADLVLKAHGFDLFGTVFLVKEGRADRDMALLAQAGYFVLPKKVQISARFGQKPEGEETQHEVLGALTVFFHGHSFKWTLDGGVLDVTGDNGERDVQVRTQLQFVL